MDRCVIELQGAPKRWAANATVPVLCVGDRVRPGYTRDVADNLFEPLSDAARVQFEGADGHELRHGKTRPAKMAALHSSSALACNFFHYWSTRGILAPVLEACKLPVALVARFVLETKLEVDPSFERAPNLDACVIYGTDSRLAVAGIECKFCEPYSPTKERLSVRYVAPELAHLWEGRPALRALAEVCATQDSGYRHLDVPQLLKHLLGLRNQSAGHPAHLLYLYFDHSGHAAAWHRNEIQKFLAVTAIDQVGFSALAYQTAMARLAC